MCLFLLERVLLIEYRHSCSVTWSPQIALYLHLNNIVTYTEEVREEEEEKKKNVKQATTITTTTITIT